MQEKKVYMLNELEGLRSLVNGMFETEEVMLLHCDSVVEHHTWLRPVLLPFTNEYNRKVLEEVAAAGFGRPTATIAGNQQPATFEGEHTPVTRVITIIFPKELIRKIRWLKEVENRFYFREEVKDRYTLLKFRGTVGDSEDGVTDSRVH
jgi:hypothetical protein